MTRSSRSLPLALTALTISTFAIGACGRSVAPAADPLGQGVTVSKKANPGQGDVTLSVRPMVVAGGVHTLAVVEKYTKSSIQHLTIQVFKLDGAGTELPVVAGDNLPMAVDLLATELDDLVTFSHLWRETTYRIRCTAYKAPGTSPDDQISVDAESFVDVAVAHDNRPQHADLRVKLKDVVFNGQAESNITVIDGGYVDAGSVTITRSAPAPSPTPTFSPIPGQIDGTQGPSPTPPVPTPEPTLAPVPTPAPTAPVGTTTSLTGSLASYVQNGSFAASGLPAGTYTVNIEWYSFMGANVVLRNDSGLQLALQEIVPSTTVPVLLNVGGGGQVSFTLDAMLPIMQPQSGTFTI